MIKEKNKIIKAAAMRMNRRQNIHFIDIPRFVVYNSLVYVLMEFRGHTKISTLI